MVVKHNILNVEKVFQGEQGRGILTSVISGVLANGLVYFGTNVLGMSIESSAAIFGLIVGNIIGYFADIMFAKQNFTINGQNVILPLTAFGKKFSWLLKSILSKSFFRFWIIVFIDMIMTVTIVGYLTKYFDQYELFSYSWRNSAIVLAFAIASFIIYVNPLRFTWAYNESEDPNMNMMILMWFTISLLIYVSIKNMELKTDSQEESQLQPNLMAVQLVAPTVPSEPAQLPKLVQSSSERKEVPLPTESYNHPSLANVAPVTRPPVEVHNQETLLQQGLDDLDQNYKKINQKVSDLF